MEWTALGQRIKERLASDVVPLAVLLAVVVCALTVWWIRRPETERMGTLCVETAPLAAEVTLDGTFCGLSPLAIPDVTYGERVLRIEKSGFKPSSQAVNIERKETSIQVTLQAEKLTIDLSVASDPPGALVRLAGETVGWTPARVEGLAPGSYDLVIRKEGYKPHQQSITLGAGLPASVKVTLQSKTEEVLEARVEETGASVRACVELAHHYILANDFERAAPPLAKALEMISGTGQKNRWVMEEIEKPYWEHYSYGDKEAVEACRCMLEDVLIAELKARPSHKIARDLLVDLLRKAGRWDRLAEAMSAGVVSVKDASPRELGLYGEAMVRAGRGGEVLGTMTRSYRGNRDCWELTYAIALAYQEKGEKVKARIKLKQALLHCPNADARQRVQATLDKL